MPELNVNWNPATFKVLSVVFSTNVHEIVLINYENSSRKRKKTVECLVKKKNNSVWYLTVIKTLVISKITHLFTNLPDPDEKVSPGPELVSIQISLGWQT